MTTAELAVAGVLAFILLILLYLLLRRPPRTRLSRFGVFVERERINDNERAEEDQGETQPWPRHDPPLD